MGEDIVRKKEPIPLHPDQDEDQSVSVLKFSTHCAVCGMLLAPSSELSGRTCLRFACEQELTRRKREGFGQKKCRYCFLPLTIHMAMRGESCEEQRCQELQRHQRLQEDAHRRRQAILQQINEWREILGATDSGSHLFQIPASKRLLLPLPSDDERRSNLHHHLLSLFDELEQTSDNNDPSHEPDATGESESSEVSGVTERTTTTDAPAIPVQGEKGGFPMALLAATCRTCRGECCLRGKDKAYLTAETIQRLQRHRPDLDKAAIVQGYMDATPAHVNEGSCIYHGEAGCGLPLTWRSDTCNSYFCGPVHKLRLQSFSQGQELIAVATDQNEIVRIARFDEENYTAVYPEEMTEPASQKEP